MITLISTVLFCLGWRIVTDEGQLLYSIRKYFELKSALNQRDFRESFTLSENIHYYIGKPLVLCITCMASIWGVTVFIYLNGISYSLIVPMLFNSICASFIQTFIYKLYVKLD